METQREHLTERVRVLRREGVCPTCYDLAHDGALFGNREAIFEDDLFKVVLERYPRMKGHAVVIYKPHHADISDLSADEVAQVFQVSARVVQAIKRALGAEKVYLATMCDGEPSHFHLQLFPRYPGDPIGSKRFVAPRGPLSDAEETTGHIRAALAEGRQVLSPG